MNLSKHCAQRRLDLDSPKIMGILNLTPDSFSDGGRFFLRDQALAQVERMVAEGVDIVDVGGESTRPGAAAVSEAEEIERVTPLIEAIAQRIDVPISVDTSKAGVMRSAVTAGACMINDVAALRGENALSVAAELAVPVCLMHMQGEPRTMQVDPQYGDVTVEVQQFLLQRADACMQAGILRENILLDPGFGFGKSVVHNCQLLKNLSTLLKSGFPLLVGISRKSMLGAITGREVDDRLAASLAAATMALQKGASILRVHDVAQTRDALLVWKAIETSS